MYGATIGKLGLLNITTTTNQACCVIDESICFNNKFIFYWFISNRNHIINMSYGGGQPNISQDLIRNLKLQCPSIEEQTAIADYLDRKTSEIDDLIAQKEELLKLYEEEKTAIINQAVTKGINPDVKLKDSGIEWLGEIPEHWKVKKLKYVAYFQRGFDLSSTSFIEGNFPVYGSNGIIGYHNEMTTHGPSITIGRSGSVGEVNFISEDYWAHNTSLFLLNNYNNNVNFLFHLLKSIDLKSQSSGTAVGTLNRNNIHQLAIGLPQKSEQTAIVSHIEKETTRINTKIKKQKSS
ncbi:MAG: restriction endonuclease subunit S [bacterium]